MASRPPNSWSIVKVDEDINMMWSGCVRNSSQRTNFTAGTESCGSRRKMAHCCEVSQPGPEQCGTEEGQAYRRDG